MQPMLGLVQGVVILLLLHAVSADITCVQCFAQNECLDESTTKTCASGQCTTMVGTAQGTINIMKDCNTDPTKQIGKCVTEDMIGYILETCVCDTELCNKKAPTTTTVTTSTSTTTTAAALVTSAGSQTTSGSRTAVAGAAGTTTLSEIMKNGGKRIFHLTFGFGGILSVCLFALALIF